ncbi:MAG: hypothetical protein AMXMBFR64_03990 [Myxococcales bacterium]
MGERARILVIDDEPFIGRVVARSLSGDHDVTVSSSGGEALSVLRTGQSFDLILCDLMMPGMTGMDLFEAIEAEWPAMVDRVVFLTGGAFTARARTFLSGRQGRLIDKPFTSDDLRGYVGSALCHHRQAQSA